MCSNWIFFMMHFSVTVMTFFAKQKREKENKHWTRIRRWYKISNGLFSIQLQQRCILIINKIPLRTAFQWHESLLMVFSLFHAHKEIYSIRFNCHQYRCESHSISSLLIVSLELQTSQRESKRIFNVTRPNEIRHSFLFRLWIINCAFILW